MQHIKYRTVHDSMAMTRALLAIALLNTTRVAYSPSVTLLSCVVNESILSSSNFDILIVEFHRQISTFKRFVSAKYSSKRFHVGYVKARNMCPIQSYVSGHAFVTFHN